MHVDFQTPTASLLQHQGPVTSLCRGASETLISSSLDHSIRVWDVELQSCSNVLVFIFCLFFTMCQIASSAILSVSFSHRTGLIASAQADQTVKLWDTRVSGMFFASFTSGVESKMTLSTMKSHSNFVSCVSWNPEGNSLVSGSYDGTLKIWDIRSTTPLYTIHPKTPSSPSDENVQKILCAQWGKEEIVSGGENGQLSIHALKDHSFQSVGH